MTDNILFRQFDGLTPVEELTGRRYKCKCLCGNYAIVEKYLLTTGRKKNCGCGSTFRRFIQWLGYNNKD